MSGTKSTDDFKRGAVALVADRKHPLRGVADLLGVR
jgi:hypothetical protein